MVNCPLCDAALDYDEEELDEGDELTCDECGEMLRITSKDPLELEAVDDDDDDEDDDDEDFDDDESEEDYDEDEEDDDEWR